MSITGQFKLDPSFKKTVIGRYERYRFQAGILHDAPHRVALSKKRGLTTVAGGPARKMSSTKTRGRVSDVGEAIRNRGDDYLRRPFQTRDSADMRAFLKAFGQLLSGAAKSVKATEAALLKVITHPIIEQRYGRNSRWWERVKGFNRKMIDTGQFLKALAAKVTRSERV